MNISPTLTGPLPNAQTSAAQASSAISSDFETFLKMMTVQMQNQDPLEPIKSEDFAVQLATFSGVEQQVRTNELMSAMGAQLSLMGMSQMAGWVGMQARAPVAGYFDGNPITLSPNPPVIADRVELIVRDAAGQTVQRSVIPTQAGAMEWDGANADGSPYPDGLYTFEIESFSNGALVATSPVELYATIAEARTQGGETVLITRGGAEVPASQVTALRDPAFGF